MGGVVCGWCRVWVVSRELIGEKRIIEAFVCEDTGSNKGDSENNFNLCARAHLIRVHPPRAGHNLCVPRAAEANAKTSGL